MEAIIVVVLTIPLLFAIFCFIKGERKMRLYLGIFNGVIYGIFLVLVLLNIINMSQVDKDREHYDIYRGTILSGWNYDKTDNKYHYLHDSYLFGSTSYVVPVETCEMSPIVKLTSNIIVYTLPGNSITQDDPIMIDKWSYHYAPMIIKIVPDYWNFAFTYAIYGFFVLLVGNLVPLILIIVKLVKKKKSTSETK